MLGLIFSGFSVFSSCFQMMSLFFNTSDGMAAAKWTSHERAIIRFNISSREFKSQTLSVAVCAGVEVASLMAVVFVFILLSAVAVCQILKRAWIVVEQHKWVVNVRARILKDRLLKERCNRKKISLDYDPTCCGSLDRFGPSKAISPCLFAKRAILWGSREYDREKKLEENALSNVEALSKFVNMAEDDSECLDGFLIEIRGKQFCDTVESFAATVRVVLTTISENDPSSLNVMKMKSINTSSWYFSFDMVPIFVTTFAPCYPKSSPRSLFLPDRNSADSCFVLLQPEYSFLRHGIGADDAKTNWDVPQTIRDKIRVNFLNKKQPYHIPPSLSYPVASTIVHSSDGKEHSINFWDDVKYSLVTELNQCK